ncbi:hypothetical protein M775_03990 [Neisseria gonorrhoeae MU_NG6]|nr:hypothetical protein M786_01770 [Neisseria gonorrhoeae MU_NG21]KLS89264.1 hypothetical protein M775_03990 [Neisseria gonorrhoeae MU_NG6]
MILSFFQNFRGVLYGIRVFFSMDKAFWKYVQTA